jgi:hypothetical protein
VNDFGEASTRLRGWLGGFRGMVLVVTPAEYYWRAKKTES